MPRPAKKPSSYAFAADLRHRQTDAETALWNELRAHRFSEIHFRRQHPIGPYIADFCSTSSKIVIELDGGDHLTQEIYDNRRSAYLEEHGYRVLRFWNDEVLKDMDIVLQTILEELNSSTGRLPPP